MSESINKIKVKDITYDVEDSVARGSAIQDSSLQITTASDSVSISYTDLEGETFEVPIPAATTEKAGVMSAKDCKRLFYNNYQVITANGTPENSGNAMAVRCNQIIPVKKGDKLIVKAETSIPSGCELRYGYAGVKALDKTTLIGSNRTEGRGYSEAGNTENSFVFEKDETIGALFCVVLYDTVNETYISLQDKQVALFASVVPENFVAKRYDGIRFITDSNSIPIIDAKSKILDLGTDPILLVGDKAFPLKDYGNTHRSIYLTHSSGTSATKVLFNVDNHTFKTERYAYENLSKEVTICSTRMANGKIFDVSAPFNYKLVNADMVEYTYTGSDVTLIQSLNNKDDIVTLDPVNTIIDFGVDPILIIKGTSYILKNVCANWRTLNYKENIASSAIKIIFNTETKLLRSEMYSNTLVSGDVVIGSIRHKAADNVIASFPFDYKIKGVVANENIGQIQSRTGIDFIAHRGIAQNGIPENSLDAYRYAGYCGFKYVETDFYPTKDNELVLMHDVSINRTMMNKSDYSTIADTVNVTDKTLQELRDNYVLKSSDARFRREIPTLAEFFNTCKHSGVFPIAEIKTSGTTQEHVLQAYELGKSILGEGNFGFTSFSNELLDYARSLSEKTPLWYINTKIVGTTNTITGKSRENDTTWWYPNYSTLTEEDVKAHKMVGIKVAAWTVPVASVDELIKLNIDSIAGDNLSSDICGLVGKVAKSAKGFSDFATNGTVVNNILSLTSGQTLTSTMDAGWLGGYFLSIIAKGNFKVTAKNLSTTLVADKPERFIYQGLATGASIFKIEAVGDTQVEFVEIGVVEF